MPKLLFGSLTAFEKPARNAIIVRKEDGALDLHVVFARGQAVALIAECTMTEKSAALTAQTVAGLARSGLPEASDRAPVVLHGLAAASLWAPLLDALSDGGTSAVSRAPVAFGKPGINSAWIPTHEGDTEGFFSHTDGASRNCLTVVHSREQALEVLGRYRRIDDASYLASVRKRIGECVLPETSDRPTEEIEGGVANLVRTALMLMRLPQEAN